MRISDWSSDVCSSDLGGAHLDPRIGPLARLSHARADAAPGRGADQPRRRQWRFPGTGADLLRPSRGVSRVERAALRIGHAEIGRASCRERMCKYGVDIGGRPILKKKKNKRQKL